MIRIGYSKDIHRLKSGKRLNLGGIEIDSPYETIAHSDGDVLLHAISEALLGALALRDLGYHFPDTLTATKDLASTTILTTVYDMILKKGYQLTNIDSMVLLEKPKLSPHIDAMRHRVAALLKTDINTISIKATTFEGLGDGGNHQAIEAHATVLLQKNPTIKKL